MSMRPQLSKLTFLFVTLVGPSLSCEEGAHGNEHSGSASSQHFNEHSSATGAASSSNTEISSSHLSSEDSSMSSGVETSSSPSTSHSETSDSDSTSSEIPEFVTAGACPELATVMIWPELNYRVLAEGNWGIESELEPTEVIRDQTALEALFAKLEAGGTGGELEVPVVDFSQKVVLASAVHNSSTCGIDREIFRVRQGVQGPHLDVIFYDRSLGCDTVCWLEVSAWLVVEIDRSSTPSICTRTRPGCRSDATSG
jgi:hypothetical protein